jgi:predicted dehydrogenase
MNTLNRRTFLGTATTATLLAQALVTQAADSTPPTPKLKMGLIGCGWYGMVDVKAACKCGGVEIIGLCDVDSEHLEKSAAEVEKIQGQRPRTFKRHEELLAMPGLQAVIIATPPHWHALQFIAALEHKLDVYCEKPLAYDVREGQAMVAAANKSGRIIQIGFQRRQSLAIQQARQYLQSGQAGRIINAEAQIHYTAGVKDATPQKPPTTLDWDLWCGPGPLLPYSPQIGHMNWRLEKESGHGHLVDWGIHLIDATRWILGAQMPRTVSAMGGLYYLQGKITTPDILTAHFEFEQCPVTWRHRIWGAEEYQPEVSNGIFFYGEKETVFVTDNKWVVIPRGKGKERREMEAKADAGVLHMAEFLQAVRKRQQPGCSTLDAFHSTATVKLAMIALETGSRIQWDAQTMSIPGNPAANQLLKRAYRAPHQHPWKG